MRWKLQGLMSTRSLPYNDDSSDKRAGVVFDSFSVSFQMGKSVGGIHLLLLVVMATAMETSIYSLPVSSPTPVDSIGKFLSPLLQILEGRRCLKQGTCISGRYPAAVADVATGHVLQLNDVLQPRPDLDLQCLKVYFVILYCMNA
jgi:hypothetical protein